MTKHTDTSRIADLRFQVSEKMPINHSDLSGLFDHIEALEAENERLCEALKFYARENSWRSCGMYMSGRPNPSAAEIDAGNKARKALEPQQ